MPFIEKALNGHKMVKSFSVENLDDYILLHITRNSAKSLITIWVSDAYFFWVSQYYERPKNIDFIYLAKPEASYSDEIVDFVTKDGLNIWKFWALMGVLYQDNIADYIPPERRKDE